MDYANITAQEIEAEAVKARLTMTAVLNKAGVGRAAFYRARAGNGSMRPLTKARLMDAIKELTK